MLFNYVRITNNTWGQARIQGCHRHVWIRNGPTVPFVTVCYKGIPQVLPEESEEFFPHYLPLELPSLHTKVLIATIILLPSEAIWRES